MTDSEKVQTSLACGGELNQATFDDFVNRLKIHFKDKHEVDHCTGDPIFLVQKKVHISGLETDYTEDRMIVVDCESEYTSIEEWLEDLDPTQREHIDILAREANDSDFASMDENDQYDLIADLDDHIVTGYKEDWEYVNSHFTREAAEAFIARKKHDYPRGLRIYVDSQYWCWEFKAIVKGLMDGKIAFKGDSNE